MNFYPENYDVTVSVPLIGPGGALVTPDSVTAVLLNEEGEQVVDLGSQAFSSGDENIDILISSSNLVMGADRSRAAFTLNAVISVPAGSFSRNVTFAVERAHPMQIMKNTFMTYAMAELMASVMVNAEGWSGADENERKTALFEAFDRITQIPMTFTPRSENGKLLEKKTQVIPRDLWAAETVADFQSYPKDFREALRRAQLVEADNMLKGDRIAEMRRDGIISETIGESQVRLSERVAEYGICADALKALTGYINFDVRIARG